MFSWVVAIAHCIAVADYFEKESSNLTKFVECDILQKRIIIIIIMIINNYQVVLRTYFEIMPYGISVNRVIESSYYLRVQEYELPYY